LREAIQLVTEDLLGVQPDARRGRAIGAGLLVTSLVAGLLAINAARATTTVTTSRLAGANRFDTAKSVARAAFSTADVALIANGRAFPDALAGAFYAGTLPGPILLTERNALPDETKQALAALQTKEVVILGGPVAVSDAVATQLSQMNTTAPGGGALIVRRIGGTDRYDTARLVATEAGPEVVGTSDGKKTAFLASGINFADALAAGPLAVTLKFPILLTDPNAVSPPVRQAFGALAIRRVILLGGTRAVSESVATALRQDGYEVVRIGGENRQETAALLADGYINALGCRFEHVGLSRGDDFPDALAGGPRAGLRPEPILLTVSKDTLGSAAENWLQRHRDSVDTIEAFGGPAAVSDSVLDAARQAANGSTNVTTSTSKPASTTTTKKPTTTTTTSGGLPLPIGGSAGASQAAAVPAAGPLDPILEILFPTTTTTRRPGTSTSTTKVGGTTTTAPLCTPTPTIPPTSTTVTSTTAVPLTTTTEP
jgi:putative cell wall-binding protein